MTTLVTVSVEDIAATDCQLLLMPLVSWFRAMVSVKRDIVLR
jgi:hypothetical protein